MSFEEFAKLPEPASCRYELRQGELVQVPPRKRKHRRIQDGLVELLRPIAGNGYLNIEVVFRALSEGEFRTADVAYVSRTRWDKVADHDDLRGAPDLVIEVLPPCNTASEMAERRKLCIENGCHEFWMVDPDLHQIDISTPDAIATTYRSGQRIPLRLFGGADFLLDEIFEIR